MDAAVNTDDDDNNNNYEPNVEAWELEKSTDTTEEDASRNQTATTTPSVPSLQRIKMMTTRNKNRRLHRSNYNNNNNKYQPTRDHDSLEPEEEDDDEKNVDGIFRMRTTSSIEEEEEFGGYVYNNDNDTSNHNFGSCPKFWAGIAIGTLLLLIFASVTVGHNPKVKTPEEQTKNDNNVDFFIPSSVSSTALLSELEHAAVASDHEICSTLGARLLLPENRGNAIDAAVTVALCLGLVNPASSGIGGGAFMLIRGTPRPSYQLPDHIDARDHKNNNNNNDNEPILEVVDCREVAGEYANTTMYQDKPNNASVWGGLAIPIFGELKCLELAHAKFGRLTWAQVLDPVVQLAEEGFPIGPYLAHQIQILAKKFQNDDRSTTIPLDGLRKAFTRHNSWNNPLVEGDFYKNFELAETLQRIRDLGVTAALYDGDAAETLAREIQNAGGIITAKDIRSYRATLRSPLIVPATDLHGFAMVGVPPPSSGGATVLGIARFLAGFDEPLAAFPETLSQHRFVEACKHAFAIRMSLSDPNYNTETVIDAVRDLVQSQYMAALRQNQYMDNATLALSRYGGNKWAKLNDTDDSSMTNNNNNTNNISDAQEGDRHRTTRQQRAALRHLLRKYGYLEDSGTSHFAIVDENRNAVAMTTSINTNFGSGIRSPSTGIIFSNTMDDFANPGKPDFFGLIPAESNYIQPGKRPLSSMSPTMVFRTTKEDSQSNSSRLGDLRLVIGASGGPKIITAVSQVLLRHVFMGEPLLEALVHPRLHDQLIYHGAAVTTTEKVKLHDLDLDVSDRTRASLERRGHKLLDIGTCNKKRMPNLYYLYLT
jgi:gamma-glutamyltranspeptidase